MTRLRASTTWTMFASSVVWASTRGSAPWRTRAATSWARRRAASSTWLSSVRRMTTISRTAPMSRVQATTTAAAAVVLALMVESGDDERSAAIGVEPVADQPHGLDRVTAERRVDLLPQVAGVHLHDVGAALERVVPDVVEDLLLGHHVTRPTHEVLQQGELAGRQLDLGVAPPAPVR